MARQSFSTVVNGIFFEGWFDDEDLDEDQKGPLRDWVRAHFSPEILEPFASRTITLCPECEDLEIGFADGDPCTYCANIKVIEIGTVRRGRIRK